MSDRASKYRTQRRQELLAALDNCEDLIDAFEKTFLAFATEYQKAFGQLMRAGDRYDKTRSPDHAEWGELWLEGIEPEQLGLDEFDTAFADAKDTIAGLRREL